MGAPDKVVQRILRHAKPHVTKEHYVKVFDRTVLEDLARIRPVGAPAKWWRR